VSSIHTSEFKQGEWKRNYLSVIIATREDFFILKDLYTKFRAREVLRTREVDLEDPSSIILLFQYVASEMLQSRIA